ncbi:MAG: UbiA family prenyltransferase [Methanomassiliicoccales archaeon]|nr:UbiA family prenyltransferase [Methanomassiliicoccales archaeon]
MSDSNVVAEYMKLLRLWNGAIAALGLLLGAAVAIGINNLDSHLFELALGTIIVVLFVGAGNSLNDYYDVEIDRIAHPKRPIVKGTVSRRIALLSAGVMFAACFALSIWINLLSLAIVALAIIGMAAYELKLKRAGLVGNIIIALLVAALFEFAGAVVGRADLAIELALLAALAMLGREIVKDIEDMDGDLTRKTLPRTVGAKRAGYIALVPTLAAVALSPMPYLQNLLTYLYIFVVIIADVIFVYGGIVQLSNPKRGQKIYKWAMIVALLAFAVGVQT